VRGQYVVNIGDMMQQWTNDRWISNVHRVANPQGGDGIGERRQSVGFFLHPNYDARIECLPSCQDWAAPARYPPVLAGELMKQKMLNRAA
jgi:isopenicillin N synthase-like dioxygenase